MVYIVVFVFGAIIGSFLNVIIYRYNTGGSIIKGGSQCFNCGKKLKWSELIPILSFVIQKGRCRSCRSRISIQYPLVEFFTGIIFVLVFQITHYSLLVTGYYFIIFGLLIVIAVYDLKHQIIPNPFVYSFIGFSFFSPIITRYSLLVTDYVSYFLAGLAFFSFFGLFWLVSKGTWMGLGDAKLALGIGWLLGFSKGMVALLFSFWIGAVVSIFLLFLDRKRYNLKSRIAFGPFLILGIIIAFLFGGDIIKII